MPASVAFTLFVLASAIPCAFAAGCYPRCRFTFCPARGNTFGVGLANDVPFTTAICDSTGKVSVGHVDSTGEAYVVESARNTRISKWAPAGLLQPFPYSFFKSFGLNATLYEGRDLSGIGHETPQRNQAEFLDGRCFAVPLTSYQVLAEEGHVVDNIHPKKPLIDCVSFRAKISASEAEALNKEHDQKPAAMDEPKKQKTPAPVEAPSKAPEATPPPKKAESMPKDMPKSDAPKTDDAPPPAASTSYPPTKQPPVEKTPALESFTPSMEQKPPAMADLESLSCDAGCPKASDLKPMYGACTSQLSGRPQDEYWVFAAANGGSAEGKSCGTADKAGKQMCVGKLTAAEWCGSGFGCTGASEAYRPQLVKCVSKDGKVCKLSAVQREHMILEKIVDGSDFFVSCRQ